MNKHILIIDDDTDLSYIMSDMLESYGYQVSHAENASMAFDMLSENKYHRRSVNINGAHSLAA